jgi:hypothetical protein
LFFQKASRSRKTKKVAEQFGLEKEQELKRIYLSNPENMKQASKDDIYFIFKNGTANNPSKAP